MRSLLFLLCVILFACRASAYHFTWTGAALDSQWTTAGNWVRTGSGSGNLVPSGNDTVFIVGSGTYYVKVGGTTNGNGLSVGSTNSAQSAVCKRLVIQNATVNWRPKFYNQNLGTISVVCETNNGSMLIDNSIINMGGYGLFGSHDASPSTSTPIITNSTINTGFNSAIYNSGEFAISSKLVLANCTINAYSDVGLGDYADVNVSGCTFNTARFNVSKSISSNGTVFLHNSQVNLSYQPLLPSMTPGMYFSNGVLYNTSNFNVTFLDALMPCNKTYGFTLSKGVFDGNITSEITDSQTIFNLNVDSVLITGNITLAGGNIILTTGASNLQNRLMLAGNLIHNGRVNTGGYPCNPGWETVYKKEVKVGTSTAFTTYGVRSNYMNRIIFTGSSNSVVRWPAPMYFDTLTVAKTGCGKVIFENTPAYVNSKLEVASGKLEMRAVNTHPYTLVADKGLTITAGASLTLLPDSLGNPFHTAVGGHVEDFNSATDTTACAGLTIVGAGGLTAYTSLNGAPVVTTPTIRLQDSAASHLQFLSGTSTRDINLASNLTVRTLNLGYIRPVLGAHNLRVRDSITGFTTASNGCVKTMGTGKLIIEGIGTGEKQNVLFPVFNSSYNPVVIQNNGTADAFGVRVTNNLLQHGDSGMAITSGAVGRTWFVEEDVPGGSNASLKVQWNNDNALTGFTPSTCYLAHRRGAYWDAGPVLAAVGSGPRTLTRNGITSFSPFAVVSNLSQLGGLIITSQPASADVCAGTSTMLSLGVLNADGLQWRKDGIPISGATASSLNINPVLPISAGVYDVSITGSGQTIFSEPANLTVNKNVWSGAFNSAWSNPSNWNSCGVPSASSFVEIPAAVPVMPMVTTPVSVWQLNSLGDVTIAPGGALDVLGH